LGLLDLADYRTYLEAEPDEWALLDSVAWISISRFYRDRRVFEQIERQVLPQLAASRGHGEIRCWSAGCAAGEEPYTVALIWHHSFSSQFPLLRLRIVATDIDPVALRRAERACYRPSSVRELPPPWRAGAFVEVAGELCLKDDYRHLVTFIRQDIRTQAPEGPFDLILCRNLVFTYFDETMQRKVLKVLSDRLTPDGVLIIGNLESLPDGRSGLFQPSGQRGIYRKDAQGRIYAHS
jgi:chemotaxis protein methyltransferase CheR